MINTKDIILREILSDIRDHLDRKEITVIVGPRRAGKTTILNVLRAELEAGGASTYYFNLDRERDRVLFTNQEQVLSFVKQQLRLLPDGQILYVFIDEIQRKENAGLFLKGIYDVLEVEHKPVKLVITGSGSLELKEKVKESLAGRKRMFTVRTVSFSELLCYRHSLESQSKIDEYAELFGDEVYQDLVEYLNFGGYPEVILAETEADKKEALAEIYDSYIEKDIRQLLRIEKSDKLSNLLRVLASQVGNLINKAELASTVGVSENTIESYLWYLEKTFVITRLLPFYKNPRKEITKMPMIYFDDLGLRSFVSGNFDLNPHTSLGGGVFENFVLRGLHDAIEPGERIRFWRTQLGAEVDFIIGSYDQPVPIEVKMKNCKQKPSYGKSLHSFIRKYHPDQAYFYNLDTDQEARISSTSVRSLRFYQNIRGTV